MEQQRQPMRLTGAVTKRSGPEPRQTRPESKTRESRARAGHSQARTYLIVRLAVCALLLCGALALKLTGARDSAVLSTLSTALGNEREREPSELGRLRFVQIPSIIDVFAPKNKPILPASASGFSLLEDDTVLCLNVERGSVATSPYEGSVRAIGSDETYGNYVSIAAPNDTEYFVYGLDSIAVEPGQPLGKNSILGYASGDKLFVSVRSEGRPLDVSSVFDLGSLG